MASAGADAWADDVEARLVETFEAARNREKARAMGAYMRDQFAFLGLATPEREAAARVALAGIRVPSDDELVTVTRALWGRPEREYQYVACDLLDRYGEERPPNFLGHLRWCIAHRSWWDTVDSVRKPVGRLVLAHPELVEQMQAWNADGDRWLVRSSIIFQLGYREATDAALLFELCARRATDPEFFVRKAIGWALREYSKFDGDAVRAFVMTHPELSTLSRREALRRLPA